MKHSHKFGWPVFVCLVLLIFVVAVAFTKPFDWYLWNPKYALWRMGLYHYDDQAIYRGLNGDVWANNVVRGKTVPELRNLFQNLRDISEFNDVDLAKVAPLTNSACTFVKWGNHDLFIEITNGKASSINLWKG